MMLIRSSRPRPSNRSARRAIVAAAVCAATAFGARFTLAKEITPRAETEAMLGSDDVADDVAIWVHPNEPASSVILGTNKSNDTTGGIYAFDLAGRRFDRVPVWVEERNVFGLGERYNNVDVRYGFPAGDERWDLVCASNRSDRTIDVYRVNTGSDSDFRGLTLVGAIPIGSGFDSGTASPYGLCMYHSRRWDRYFVFVSGYQGRVAQFEMRYDPNGAKGRRILGKRYGAGASPWDLSGGRCPVEGIVADDERDEIYVALEDYGIYRFSTQTGLLSTNGAVRIASADRTATGRGALVADIEGLTIYYGSNGAGYLIASSQGQEPRVPPARFHLRRVSTRARAGPGQRAPPELLGAFEVRERRESSSPTAST